MLLSLLTRSDAPLGVVQIAYPDPGFCILASQLGGKDIGYSNAYLNSQDYRSLGLEILVSRSLEVWTSEPNPVLAYSR